jgi:nicotinamide-nucleotide amidase
MPTLAAMAEAVGALLKERNETVAVSESSTGGLISAAMLAVPGASAYFIGGGVIYTHKAREVLLDARLEAHPGMRASTEPYALLCASAIRERLGTTWGLGETGATGPGGNRYGDPRATAASRCGARALAASRWRPAKPTARPTCGASPRKRSNCSSR